MTNKRVGIKRKPFTEEWKKNMSLARKEDWKKRKWSKDPAETVRKRKETLDKRKITKTCKLCNKEFKVIASRHDALFCNNKCYKKYNWGENHPLFGKKNNEASHWKGDDAKYCAIHVWIHRNIGKASDFKCVDCEKQAAQWSNVDHKYSRKTEEYIPRCVKCHKNYDKNL